MNTLEELKSGKLKGIKRLKIASGLTSFPNEIFDLADSLEILDLTNNNLSELPEHFPILTNLKIAFFSENKFTKFPSVLGKCPKLEMIGFKANQISEIEENAIPFQTRWLILTDNKISSLPSTIGNCTRLQKCMLAGNLLHELPASMKNCTNIELLRISANQFHHLPEWLFSLPKLSWLACAGNPVFKNINSQKTSLPTFDFNKIKVNELLGEGASGLIYKISLPDETEAALKIFKGELTSDGLPDDELLASKNIPYHANLVEILGEINNHPKDKKGLVLKLIPSNYKNLGNPPSLDSCTRDTFPNSTTFKSVDILHLAKKMASVANHLISNGVLHGDFYAHNTLIDENFNPLFGDFGAAFLFDINNKELKTKFEKIEVRAYGSFLDDLIPFTQGEEIEKLKSVIKICFNPNPELRPTFSEIENILSI